MKYIIIGAVAGGASTAARLRRLDEHAEIVIFEKGEYISYANCGLPYYIGDVIKDRNKLFVQSASSFAARFNADVRVCTEVTSIDPAKKTVTVFDLNNFKVYEEPYDKLILSPGARPLIPPLPGVDLEGVFSLRNVADTDYIKEYISRVSARKAVILGAGFIGLEMAENLRHLGMEVSVIEMGGQILAATDFSIAAIAQKHLREKGLELYLDTTVEGFSRAGNNLKVLLKGGDVLDTDIVILSAGVTPDTRLAKAAGLKTGAAKGILVNEYLQTSDENIYAVGDVIEFPNPVTGEPVVSSLAGPANKQGRICADNLVSGNKRQYRGSVNTAIVKLFDLTVGVTGITAAGLKEKGISHLVSVIHSNSHAGYYPGASLMTIQIVFAPESGRLLGAQIIGGEGVDKRLDVFAAVITNKGSIYDLTEIEHGYAPPFSSAKDPVNMAGFVAENILTGRLKTVQCTDLVNIGADAVLVDVRTEKEYIAGTINGALNIPLDDIRGRLADFPADRDIYIFCQQGMRGYLAQRILTQNGFKKVLNLAGGYLLWKIYADEWRNLCKL